MASERTSDDPVVERGSLPLDIDDVHVLLQGQFVCLFLYKHIKQLNIQARTV